MAALTRRDDRHGGARRLRVGPAPDRPHAGESVAAWGHRVAGPAATRWLIAPALQGIYATSPDVLSAAAIFGRRAPARSRGRASERHRLAPGTDAGAAGRARHDVRIRRARRGSQFIRIDTDADGDLHRRPGGRAVTDTARASSCSRRRAHPHDVAALRHRLLPPPRQRRQRLWHLVPARRGRTALGVLFNSDMFSGRSEHRSETWIYGDVSPAAISQLQSRFSPPFAPIADTHPTRRRPARGASDAGDCAPAHLRRVGARRRRLPGQPAAWLGLCGNYLGKLGVSAILETAAATAARLALHRS